MSSDEETIALYNAREDTLHERANLISTGKIEGKIEKAVEVAKKLLSRNIDISIIAESTELSIEQIEEI